MALVVFVRTKDAGINQRASYGKKRRFIVLTRSTRAHEKKGSRAWKKGKGMTWQIEKKGGSF